MSTTTPAAAGGTLDLGTGTTITRMGFGAMRITGKGIWGQPADHGTAIAVLRRAVELGVDFIDTADSYGPFVSEDLIREALHPYDGVLIATKGGLTRTGPDQWHAVGRPAYLRQCVEMSLRRLDVDVIDLWQLHRIDAEVPAEEQFGLLAELVTEGKVSHIGLSQVSVEELEAARSLLGQTIYALEIATDVGSDDGRPVVVHDGMHHCREWPSGEMPMMWAHELLESYGQPGREEITEIVDGCRTFILPLVNPDGFDRTREAPTGTTSDRGTVGLALALTGQGDMWRKNLRAVSTAVDPLADVTGPAIGASPIGPSQPDAYGIDLNRNYPFLWGDESGASSFPVDQTYRGLEPFSEPESHNVRDLVRLSCPRSVLRRWGGLGGGCLVRLLPKRRMGGGRRGWLPAHHRDGADLLADRDVGDAVG
ncbi:hypothetical protein BH23ACT9_BH23ACT9_27400 [soil metagenome]